MAQQRRPIIGLCGGGTKLSPTQQTLAHDLGNLAGRLGAHLFVSASYAVAEAAADGFSAVARRRGIMLGSIARDPAGALDKTCCAEDGTPYSSRCLDLAIFTAVADLDSPRSEARARVNILTCDAVLALPGSGGTRIDRETVLGHAPNAALRPLILLVGPAEEFSADLRSAYPHCADVAAAATQLGRHRTILESW